TLQAIFEYQTMVGELLGLPLANASMYDGSTAAAEAVLMARRLTGRERTVASAGLHPHYRQVTRTYLHGLDSELETTALSPTGQTDLAALADRMGTDASCVVVQSPNFFGVIEDVAAIAKLARDRGARSVVVVTE